MAGGLNDFEEEIALTAEVAKGLVYWLPVPLLCSFPSAIAIASMFSWIKLGDRISDKATVWIPLSAAYCLISIVSTALIIRRVIHVESPSSAEELDDLTGWCLSKIWVPSIAQAVLIAYVFFNLGPGFGTLDGSKLLWDYGIAVISLHLLYSPFSVMGMFSWIPRENHEIGSGITSNSAHLLEALQRREVVKEEAVLVAAARFETTNLPAASGEEDEFTRK